MIIDLVAGTRPEVVKLAPVYAALRLIPGVTPRWIATGQHGFLADQALGVFGIEPDVRIALDWDRSSLPSLTARLIENLGVHFHHSTPDYVLVQGDTATAFSAAQAAFLTRIPVGHVEAGLRSADISSPFPEEGFRQLIARIATDHFAPTPAAARNLYREGVDAGQVRVTGNTVVDAVTQIAALTQAPEILDGIEPGARIILVTVHRRENWDDGAKSICQAILRLRDAYKDVHFIVATHTNPRVLGPVTEALAGQDRITLSDPLTYPDFIGVLKRAYMVLSDSGGVQEEAPSFGVPVLVLRDSTERMEAVRARVARLVGSNTGRIVREASRLLATPRIRARMAIARNPFGDGLAGARIAKLITRTARPVSRSTPPRKAADKPAEHVLTSVKAA